MDRANALPFGRGHASGFATTRTIAGSASGTCFIAKAEKTAGKRTSWWVRLQMPINAPSKLRYRAWRGRSGARVRFTWPRGRFLKRGPNYAGPRIWAISSVRHGATTRKLLGGHGATIAAYWYAPAHHGPTCGRALPSLSIVNMLNKLTPVPIAGESAFK